MLLLTFQMGGVMASIKVDGKKVTYRDSHSIKQETNICKILQGEDLNKWNKRIKEVEHEKEIAQEIEDDMKNIGFHLSNFQEVRE